MKNVRIATLFLLGGIATGLLAQQTSLGKFTLGPGEKRLVIVESKTPFNAGFTNESTAEQIKSCKRICIQMSVAGDQFSMVAASVGTSIDVKPVNGKVEIIFENLEAFPIPISVFRR